MASLIREWVGINTFASATQTKLLELLGKLKQESVNTLTILVMGKGGVGKSSTVNSIIGERAVSVNPFQSEATRPFMVSRASAGFTLNIIDTPGLIEGDFINDRTLEILKRFLLNKTIDVLLYVDRLDAYRVDNLDRQDFCSKRSGALLKVVRLGAGLEKHDKQEFAIPVVLVENSEKYNKNENDKKVLPDGTAGIPHLVKTITDVVLNGSKSILVDKKLIEGSNPNERWKFFIPLIFAFQYFFVVKSMKRAIKNDIAKEGRASWYK
ncbi:hypothetical protein CIPAW_10G001500 [Carya illinoinensis]|uniref:AIG1-type G domain-containing protein n=1 Tax=Carya illinoinensis TaxID=32201 RepID=A0A8T1P5P6_CARIL|nr:hypothetical protein CIPAW_10G001500 [Carya illinoinensis]